MNHINRTLSVIAFLLGLAAVTWVAVSYIGGSPLALAVSSIIAAVYVVGALEMRRFHGHTAALARVLGNIPDDIDDIAMLEVAGPYLGEVVGVWGDWTPLQDRGVLFEEDLDTEDPWQFKNILVR